MELAAVALSKCSARAVPASQAVASSTLSSFLVTPQSDCFVLHMCCWEVTESVAAGAWAQGSSEIQLASGCLMKPVIQMKIDGLETMLSFMTTCS